MSAFLDTLFAFIKKSGTAFVVTLDRTEDAEVVSLLSKGLIQFFNKTRGEPIGLVDFAKRSKRLLKLLRDATVKVEENIDKQVTAFEAEKKGTTT
jgi:hypothetical protein